MSFLRAAPPGRQPERPEEARDRTYVVVGPREVGGKTKGEEVTLCLTDAAEAALIEAGHVEPVKEAPQPVAPPVKKAPPKK
ncbi:hypothetical protein [Streptomyces chartreusis]